ncbi:hypothetical protein B0H13DRAFT_1882654 [Mycena leptocephala]|nr:hypothetical protein B0H13DRAFT_1882654 [Mycena leptocephala]
MAWKCLLPWLHTSWLRAPSPFRHHLRGFEILLKTPLSLESSSVPPALRNHILEGTNNVDTESEDDKPASAPFPIGCTARFWLHLVPGLVIPSWPSWPNYFVYSQEYIIPAHESLKAKHPPSEARARCYKVVRSLIELCAGALDAGRSLEKFHRYNYMTPSGEIETEFPALKHTNLWGKSEAAASAIYVYVVGGGGDGSHGGSKGQQQKGNRRQRSAAEVKKVIINLHEGRRWSWRQRRSAAEGTKVIAFQTPK